MNMNPRVTKVLRNRLFVGIIVAVIVAIVLVVTTNISKADQQAGISYRAHVAYNGWLSWQKDGEMAGTVGESRRMEAIKIKLTGECTGDVIYQTYVRDMGWQNEVKNSETSGTEGQSKQIEAIKIRLAGKVSELYDVNYRVHIKNGGWQEWVSNGAIAGSESFGLRVEALEVKLVEKKIEEIGIPSDNVIDSTVIQMNTSAPEGNTSVQEQTNANIHKNSINGIEYKLLNQADAEWKDVKYPTRSGTIGKVGCMITSVAVVSSAYDKTMTPKKVMDAGYQHNYPSDSIPHFSANNYTCTMSSSSNKNTIIDNLKQGNIVVIKVKGASKFTTSQHYMALIDIKSDGSQIFVGNSYGDGAGTYNRTGWFDTDTVLYDIHEVHICVPSQDLINQYK